MPEVPQPRQRRSARTGPTSSAARASTSDTPETPRSATSPPKMTADDAKLRASLVEFYSAIGTFAYGVGMMRGDDRLHAVGEHLVAAQPAAHPDQRVGADKIADAWMTLAGRNPRIKAMLKQFMEGGAVAQVIGLHIPLVIPFLPGIPGLGRIIGGSTPPPTEPDLSAWPMPAATPDVPATTEPGPPSGWPAPAPLEVPQS